MSVDLIKSYYRLTKPGIIRGNAITALAGFLLASKGEVDFGLLLAAIGGISLVIASACVFNNYTDRGIDKKMARTKNRALVKGTISGRDALVYATVLGLGGLLILATYTNLLTAGMALLGFIFYVVVYGIYKRRSVYGTIVGSISGAVPPVVGYCAVSNNFDKGAFLLFLILVLWQMPHFYAIAMYRLKDYRSASIPVLPAVDGARVTKLHILTYILGFTAACITLTLFGFTDYIFLVVMTLLGSYWLWLGVKGFKAKSDVKWAKQMFGLSLIVLLSFSVLLSLENWLP